MSISVNSCTELRDQTVINQIVVVGLFLVSKHKEWKNLNSEENFVELFQFHSFSSIFLILAFDIC